MRLDKYLKVSRIIKRRTVANEACSGGRVTLNGKVAKPGAEVKPGDIMTIRFGDHLGRYEILAVPGTVRKEGAAEIYRVLEEEEADEGLNHRLGVDLAHLGVPGVERVALTVSRRAWSHLEEGEEVEILGNGPERGRGGGRVLLEEGLHGLQVLVDDGEDGGEDAVDHVGRGRVQLVEVRICG